MNDLLTLLDLSASPSGEPVDFPELRLRAVSTRPGSELMEGLMEAIDRACGWILHRRMISASAIQFRLEAQGRALVDLYASLVEQGLELNRESHLRLAELCSCAHLQRRARGSIISIQLDISLRPELPLLTYLTRARLA